MNKETQKQFEFPLRIKVPAIFPSFLEGNDAPEFLKEYNGRVDKDYKENPNLRVLSLRDINGIPTIINSNTFAAVLVNKIVEGQGYRTATLSDIEHTLRDGDSLGIEGNYYVDLGVVLRSRDEPNSYLANLLAEQVEARGYKLNAPLVIPSSSLELVNDSSSKAYGLVLKLKDDAQIIEAPILKESGNFNSEDVDKKTGLPTKISSKGKRYSYIKDSGLSRLDLDGVLGLGSGVEALAGSFGGGRVVVVRGSVASQNFLEDLYKQKESELLKARENLERIYQEVGKLLSK